MSNKMSISRKKQTLMVYIFLIISTFAVFWQLNYYEFINFDDPVYVTKNSYIQSGITFEGFQWAFTTAHANFWHPLTWLSLMLDYEFYGLNSGGYHLTNLLLHIASTLILFWLFNRMTKDLWQSAFVAALFALHPLHVESVAWVSERKDVLSAFFWMLTMGAYAFYVERPGYQRYLLVLTFFSLGLMSKPMLVTLPFVLLLLDYWPLNRLFPREAATKLPDVTPIIWDHKRQKAGSKKGTRKKNISPPIVSKPTEIKPSDVVLFWQLREKVPFFILSAIFSIIAFLAQRKVSIVALPLSSRIENAFVSYVTYLEKTLWPHDIAVFYPFPEQLPAWKVFGAVLLLLLISITVIVTAKRLPYLVVGWFWYIGTLVPVIGIVQLGKHALADRYTYIPLIGLFVMMAWGIPEFIKNWRYRQPALFALAALVISCLSPITLQQISYWKNSITLFEHTLKVTDRNYLAHNNLGIALRGVNRVNEAESHYIEALRIKPDDDQAHFNLGNLLLSKGKVEDAIANYTEALRIKPEYGVAHNNLGAAFMSRGRFKEAIIHYQKSIEIGSAGADTYYNLGEALFSDGQFDKSTVQFREAIRINPNFAEAYNELGRVFATQGKTGEAIGYFKQAITLNPDFAIARRNLEKALSVYIK